jgi:hypothetical protein
VSGQLHALGKVLGYLLIIECACPRADMDAMKRRKFLSLAWNGTPAVHTIARSYTY